MRLVAAMIAKNELSRYLELAVASLLEFCDEVCVVDDYSTDGTYEWLMAHTRCRVLTNPAVTFDEHEGKARQTLLNFVREAEPTHVIAVDGDEFVTDGYELRRAIEGQPATPVWSLEMREVWEADDAGMAIRQDGGWKSHPVPILWRVPPKTDERWWKIRDRALSCGREPEVVAELRHGARPTGVSVLHFGWTNLSERQRRYDRYMAIDNGRFHASRHLQSIMWQGRRVRLERALWPPTLPRDAILERVREERG